MTRVFDEQMGGGPDTVPVCHVKGSMVGFRRQDSNFESCVWDV